MPIEIRELQITATVDDNSKSAPKSSSQSATTDKDKIVAECVEQVLQILKQKSER